MHSFSRVSLAVAASALLVGSVAFPASAADSSTTTTTAVIEAGSIGVSAPAAAALSALTPGGNATADLAGVTVTDNRAGIAGWSVSVVLTDFVGTNTADIIPASNASYTPNSATVTGDAVVTAAAATNLSVPTAIQSVTAVNGNNTAIWNAAVNVTAPTDALADNFTATLTHSLL